MKFYLDSADRSAAESLLHTGLFAGLTTNPTLLAQAGVGQQEIPALVGWATDAGAQRIFIQAWGSTSAELLDTGQWIRSLGDHVVVKVPATEAGTVATRALADDGVPVLVTAVYSRVQVLPALAAGAHFIAPYLGRMNDAGRDGRAETVAIQECITAAGSTLKVLVASLREPQQASDLARAGVSEFTLNAAAWQKFFIDPLTKAAVEQFDADIAAMAPRE